MSHYFENDNNLGHKENVIKYTFKNKELVLKSDLGVFSKDRVDFGTNLLINNMIVCGNDVLDIGCGYGIVGIAVASSESKYNVVMSDVNERAINLAYNNAKLNKLNNCKVVCSNAYENLGAFDTIISNPPIRAGKNVVYEIVLGAIHHLNEGGIINVVIQKKQGALSLLEKMKEVYSKTDIIYKEKGYYIICSQK